MSKLKRIILHWTGGTYNVNKTDKEAYHFIIDGKGNVYEGTHKPEDNINCKDGNYAAHAKDHNTGSIGVSIACRRDTFTQPTRKQIEAMCKLTAELCKKYDIAIGPRTVLTHMELDPKRKIDINNIPCVAVYGKDNVGNWLRNKVIWYYRKIK